MCPGQPSENAVIEEFSERSGFEILFHHFLAVYPWASHLMYLSLAFFVCVMWIIFHSPHLLKGSKERTCESSPMERDVFTSRAEVSFGKWSA